MFLKYNEWPAGIKRNQRSNFKKSTQNYTIKDNMLHHKTKVTKDKPRDIFPDSVIVVPDTEKQRELVKMAHEGGESIEAASLSAHRGMNPTLNVLNRRFWWPNMSGQVKEFCRTCERCQKVGYTYNLRCTVARRVARFYPHPHLTKTTGIGMSYSTFPIYSYFNMLLC